MLAVGLLAGAGAGIVALSGLGSDTHAATAADIANASAIEAQVLAEGANATAAASAAGVAVTAIQPPAQAAAGVGHATAKRSATEPLPLVVVARGSAVVDTTDSLIQDFASDTAYFTADAAGVAPSTMTVTVTKDPCLLDWATRTLPTLSGASQVDTEQVCGRTSAVIAGGFTTSARDLLARAAGHADLRAVLLTGGPLTYASVATPDGYGILIVVSPAAG